MKRLILALVALAAFGTVAAASAPAPQTIKAYVTAYDYFDNTPPGSAEISNPVLHQRAGGTGTYADPITVAVGHSIIKHKDILDFAEGTRFYVPNLRRYFMVEDTCGDGNKPQNGPCHRLNKPGNKAPVGAKIWIDVWVGGGTGSTAAQGNVCMSNVTDLHTVIKDPPGNYAVVSGDILKNGKCSTGFGEVPLTV